MLKSFLKFGWTQALCCVFPASIFIILGLSKVLPLGPLTRYDFILLMCLLVQVAMVAFKLETKDELKVICLFHLIGLNLEIFKVRMGSWSYPEAGLVKIAEVPLYSGFMYASVASYICQAWKRFNLSMTHWPKPIWTWVTAAAIYINFFSHHYLWDLRWFITAGLVLVFGKTLVSFDVLQKTYKMPMVLAYFLIGFFIWVAENISTFLGAWQYPNQEQQWELVHIGKISSWFLLVIISVIIVANLKHIKGATFTYLVS